ncbi:phenylpropionate dioxygenase-like ring-hydroxylating dioxygenase large terminal subunit [Sphingomonas kaistensis]|uniref:Phenylpropionate dioxygenase-like ring-hydroxylating dioxygenase large terminal subunit n=1 Tax=Sphingomonas kaistensis TaxID=298708 RepID=A0A7X5Y6N2_9SPHN|nr:aromatic ring-hydroxylating dioxygenase subunit alpha [Sphingomonas kaistensis]NJC06091.1 phenylpropionate dioxygenase-like ring-hydroxylating dioxygenase large terminal subunit [Sphingomonas kaistensis]
MATQLRPVADPLDDLSLPGWVYWDEGFFAAEQRAFLRAAPQVVCHDSDIASPGDWRTLDYLGESIIVIRGDDGEARAFANVCRHRGSRLVDGTGGCAKVLTCPYHAWSYARDGRLVGVPHRTDYPGLDPATLGLKPVALERWHGFLFVTLEPGAPSVATMMAEHEAEIAPYRFAQLRAIGRVTLRPRALNWKTIADNYSDALHIPVGHPGLTRLFGQGYKVDAFEHVDRMEGDLVEQPSSNLSERAYQQLLPEASHLPSSHRRKWLYFKFWPNLAFDIYPDQVDFMQFLPLSGERTVIREISYALPDDRREMKAARYLNWRINRRVNAEDTELISRVQAGMRSPSYEPGPLGRSEVALRSFARKLRRLVPEARLPRSPVAG